MAKEVNLLQDSEEWLDWRRSHITATDTSVICGKNPYKTPRQLYNQKIECTEDAVNEAMLRGKKLEEEAREFISRKENLELTPKVFESTECPFMGASLDAVAKDNTIGWEIKCPGVKVMNEALNDQVSDMYIYQCQKQMLVMGWDEMFLFFYQSPQTNCTIKIFKDEKIIEEILEKEHKFWNNLINFEEPALTVSDYESNFDEEANIMASKLMNAIQTRKVLDDEIETLKAHLKDKFGKQPTKLMNAHVKYTPFSRAGTIDYKKLIEDLDIDIETLEKYKKEQTLFFKFSMFK